MLAAPLFGPAAPDAEVDEEPAAVLASRCLVVANAAVQRLAARGAGLGLTPGTGGIAEAKTTKSCARPRLETKCDDAFWCMCVCVFVWHAWRVWSAFGECAFCVCAVVCVFGVVCFS